MAKYRRNRSVAHADFTLRTMEPNDYENDRAKLLRRFNLAFSTASTVTSAMQGHTDTRLAFTRHSYSYARAHLTRQTMREQQRIETELPRQFKDKIARIFQVIDFTINTSIHKFSRFPPWSIQISLYNDLDRSTTDESMYPSVRCTEYNKKE